MSDIIVLSDEINSGKTSAIIEWKKGRTNVFGIISPKENGHRFFEDIYSGKRWAMEAHQNENAVLEVGKYRFSKSAFEVAFASIYSGIHFQGRRTIVFDEIGPLELRFLGFHSILNEALALSKQNSDLCLLCVVRKALQDQFVDLYQPYNIQVFNVLEFTTLF